MFARSALAAVVAGLACAAALGGCTTPRVKAPPSAAVLEARARAGHAGPACGADKLEDVSPTAATFGFDVADLSEAGQQRLARAAAWLKCNPSVEAVVLPSAQSRGKAQHETDLANRRGQAVVAQLRALGVQNVVKLRPAGAADDVTGPHLVIQAADRGW